MKTWMLILVAVFIRIKEVSAQINLASAKAIKTVELSDPKFDQVITCNFGPDRDARFPGGEKAFTDYLTKNLAKNHELKGVTKVTFEIEEHGILINPKIDSRFSKTFDHEILKRLFNSPTWIPGIRNGKAMRKSYIIPI